MSLANQQNEIPATLGKAALKKDKPAVDNDDVVEDKKTLAVRNKALEHMKKGPMYNSVARLMLMIGGPILTAGLMGLIGIGGAAIAPLTIAIVTTIGAALTVGGIIVDYAGTRSMQSGGLDQSEFNAQSTARHLVQELKASNMCTTFENNKRGDGRSWVQATGKGQGELQVS